MGLSPEISFPPTLIPAKRSQWKKLTMWRNENLTLTVQPRVTSRKHAIAALLLNAELSSPGQLNQLHCCTWKTRTSFVPAVALCVTPPAARRRFGKRAAGGGRQGATVSRGRARNGTERNGIRFAWQPCVPSYGMQTFSARSFRKPFTAGMTAFHSIFPKPNPNRTKPKDEWLIRLRIEAVTTVGVVKRHLSVDAWLKVG